MIINGKEEELVLEYPIGWQYKIITEKHDEIDSIIASVVKERTYKVSYSHTSKNGRYKSFDVELLVHHDEDRLALFSMFKQHPEIKMVL